MLVVCFDVKGIVHREFVPSNTTVSTDFYLYCDVLRLMRENVGQKRLVLGCNHNWFHHDSAPTHTLFIADSTYQFL
jgi:hypothetical protein